jgi:hypothetical protein
MRLPLNRDALRKRAKLDLADEQEQASKETPESRIALALELSDFAYDAADALGAQWQTDDLAEKSRLLARPLRLLRDR